MKTKTYEDLIVWQKSHVLVLEVYKLSKYFPKEELFSLTNQLRKAAISIPANIAEGYGRISQKEKIRFLNISQGSLNETKYFLRLAHELNYANTLSAQTHCIEISKMLFACIKSIRLNPPTTY
ncbi:MAG: four helix bundle protein [Candidatus Marinimicrobia bacterium]|nr:four helix bundle protein [Candidatus Neomarinimicrobiota bacterium]